MADPKIYRRGGVYYAWIFGERKSTKAHDRQAALVIARQFEREAAAARDPAHRAAHGPAQEPHVATVAEATAAFLVERRDAAISRGTMHCYSIKARHLARILGDQTALAEVTAERVDAYASQRLDEQASRNTIGKELTVLRGILSLARRRGLYAADPRAVLPSGWETGYQPRRRALSADEAGALLSALAKVLPHRAAWVALALATGARRSEVERIRREDVRMVDGAILVRGTKTERSDRVVPILSLTRPFVQAALAWGEHAGRLVKPWSNVGRDLPAALVGLGYVRATPNDLRRTLATWLRASGVEASLVAEVLGHADSRMVERVYGRLAPGQLGAAVEARLATSAGEAGRGVLNLSGTGTHARDTGDARDNREATIPAGFSVPRDGIEPPTRGFSVPVIVPRTRRKVG